MSKQPCRSVPAAAQQIAGVLFSGETPSNRRGKLAQDSRPIVGCQYHCCISADIALQLHSGLHCRAHEEGRGCTGTAIGAPVGHYGACTTV